ncbi:MAG: TAXI family TRAP transporter solute-binding subunit [Alphaproteobacteria bacterium]
MKHLKLLAVAAPLALFATTASADTFVRMVSGPAGGSWYPIGAKIAEVWGKDVKGIATSNGPGGGVGNVKDVNKGEAEVGWSYGHTVFEGWQAGTGFDKETKNVRHLATLYPAAMQTAVPKDSKIMSYADLKDKNISPGKAQWSGFAAYQMIVNEYGYSTDDVKKGGGTVHHVSYSDSVALMKDGHIDAFAGLTSYPQASFLDLEFSPGIRLLPIEEDVLNKILKRNPGYIRVELTNEHYKSVNGSVPTLGAVTVLVVNKDLPDDVVYQMTKSLWDNHGEFVKVKKVWETVQLKNALLGAAVPVHPGAQKYYDEKGVKAAM